MWSEKPKQSMAAAGRDASSERPDLKLGTKLLSVGNVTASAVTQQSWVEDSLIHRTGIIPGVISAAVFITFLLGLYALLWKCMTSQPQRRKRKVRLRVKAPPPV